MSRLGEVIITGRVAAGMTQEDLANAIGVTQAAMSRFENDLRDPDDDTIDQIAGALGITVRFLERASRPSAALALDSHMRRRATAKPTIWRQMEAQLNMLRMHSDFLREEVALAATLTIPGFDPFAVDPADAARITRTQWKMPSGPARSIVRWVEAAGSVVLMTDLGNQRVDGLSQWTADYPVIVVNSVNPTDRIRWTLAHEIGHLVLHREDATDDMEREADAFAAEFLLPEVLIGPELTNLTLGKAVDLKREWGVSVAALIQRAHQLGRLSDARRASLFKQLSARGWRTREPASDEITPERPSSSTTSPHTSVAVDSTTPNWLSLPDTAHRARTDSCPPAAAPCTPYPADPSGTDGCRDLRPDRVQHHRWHSQSGKWGPVRGFGMPARSGPARVSWSRRRTLREMGVGDGGRANGPRSQVPIGHPHGRSRRPRRLRGRACYAEVKAGCWWRCNIRGALHRPSR
jgi:Zn-dependent peptidase ImmA (M78 family)/transcriptional regulator with XRE-family HTH domain